MSQIPNHPFILAGQPAAPNHDLVVTDKYTGAPAARVALADAAVVQSAIAAAAGAVSATRALTGGQREAILLHVAARLGSHRDEFAELLVSEAGKPIRDARGEVSRALETFHVAAGEATRIGGEWLPLDGSARAAGRQGLLRRFPIGPCAFITPFNFPLNLVAHKVAPAIAAGCPFVLRPASQTPLCALRLGALLAETDWPPAACSVLPCPHGAADMLVTDDRIRLLSFTGSPDVGWALRSRAGRKHVTLELGGNAACIVDRDVDLSMVAARITHGAFYQSGQSCISVQRVLAHEAVYGALRAELRARAAELRSGDPHDEETFLGPLISEAEARRVEDWIAAAVAAGARLICGGARRGAFVEPTYLEAVDPRQKVSCAEVFGPVATLEPFSDFAEALRRANDSAYGLQCGVFTRDLSHALDAFEELEVGGVILNDVPSFRVDSMPYGGVKGSGVGREGVRYAIAEMTEPRLLVLARPPTPPV